MAAVSFQSVEAQWAVQTFPISTTLSPWPHPAQVHPGSTSQAPFQLWKWRRRHCSGQTAIFWDDNANVAADCVQETGAFVRWKHRRCRRLLQILITAQSPHSLTRPSTLVSSHLCQRTKVHHAVSQMGHNINSVITADVLAPPPPVRFHTNFY